MKPTEEEIQAQIAKLQEFKPKVRQYDAFGHSNWKDIDAQIIVLTERMSEDDILKRWDGEDVYERRDMALYALDWLNGDPLEDAPDGAEDLADTWKSLFVD